MLIILIVIGLLILGVVLVNRSNYNDWADFIGMMLVIIMTLTLSISSIAVIGTQINKEVTYQNKIYEKEMLEYRIYNMEEDVVGNEMLYNDIVEFNNELRKVKKWANNPFTNWFYVKEVATIDYVKLDENN